MNLQKQRGIVLLFAMIVVVLLLIAAVALMRSVDSSLIVAGNIAFKRDLLNQGERAIAVARQSFSVSGALATDAMRQDHVAASNYSASILPTNAQGIPEIILTNSTWSSSGMSGADITDSASGVTIRYVIDRLCTEVGPASSAKCVVASQGPKGGSGPGGNVPRAGGGISPVYRISVRITGPQNTQTYMQSTFSI